MLVPTLRSVAPWLLRIFALFWGNLFPLWRGVKSTEEVPHCPHFHPMQLYAKFYFEVCTAVYILVVITFSCFTTFCYQIAV